MSEIMEVKAIGPNQIAAMFNENGRSYFGIVSTDVFIRTAALRHTTRWMRRLSEEDKGQGHGS